MDERKRPLVSVVIPTYNRAARLRRAVNSVLTQLGVGESFDLQVIVVDDGSVDGTPAAALEYGGAISYLRQGNRGVAGARNAGIGLARGRYVAFLDDDDEWLPHRLKVQVGFAEEHPEVAVVYGQGALTGPSSDGGLWPETGPSGRVFESLLTSNPDICNLSSMLVRREVIDRAGAFDESLPALESFDFALRLALQGEFRFLNGAVAVNWASQTDGKGHRDRMSGRRENVLPVIIGRALSLLPAGVERERLSRRAWAAAFEGVAESRWSRGGPDLVRLHLVLTLKEHPWMLRLPTFRRTLTRVARGLARDHEDPVGVVRTLTSDLRRAVGRVPERERRIMVKLEALALAEAAKAQGHRGQHRASAWTAVRAAAQDLAQLLQPPIWSSVLRGTLDLPPLGWIVAVTQPTRR